MLKAVTALAEESAAYLVADQGYDTDATRGALRGQGIRDSGVLRNGLFPIHAE